MRKLLKSLRFLVHASLPWVARRDAQANEMNIREHRKLVRAVYNADWWRAWAQREDCGCTKAFGKRRLVLMDCPEHGWDTWFPDIEWNDELVDTIEDRRARGEFVDIPPDSGIEIRENE